MSATQHSFSLRVTAGVKTVHLLGSWDNYNGQLPLSKDRDRSSSKSATWKGTFRFTTTILAPGKRYWYYYIIDGYHCSHNPSVPSTVESTTGRSLNVLDVPADRSSKSSKSSHSKSSSSGKDKRSSRSRASLSLDIPKGRPLSVSQIKAPQPMSPNATRHILDVEYDDVAIEELAAQLAGAEIDSDDEIETYEYMDGINSSGSPVSSSGSSLSYRSDDGSAASGYSTPNSDCLSSTPNSDCSSCTCERYGITRKGVRVRINCGGARCGYSSGDDSCSSTSDIEDEQPAHSNSRRHGIVVRS